MKYATDYHVNQIAPSQLPDEEINEFQTNFREVMLYMKYSKDKEKLKEVIQGDGRFQDLERQAADVISAVTGAKIKYSGKEEKVNMCLAVEEMVIEDVIRAFRKFHISHEEIVQYIMEEYDRSEEEAEKLIRECKR